MDKNDAIADAGRVSMTLVTSTPRLGKFAEIAVSDIRRGRNVRDKRSSQSMKELVESIRSLGILQELLVVPSRESGKFLLVTGYGRLEAAIACGLEVVPCRILDGSLSPNETDLFQFAENYFREDLPPLTVSRTLKRLADELGFSQTELAHHLKVPQPRISEYLKLLDLSPAEQEKLERGEWTFKQACGAVKRRKRSTKSKRSTSNADNPTSPNGQLHYLGIKHDLSKSLVFADGDAVVVVSVPNKSLKPRELLTILGHAKTFWKDLFQSCSTTNGALSPKEVADES